MKWRITEALTFDQMFRLSEPKRVVRSRTVKGPPLEVRAFDDATYHFFNFKSNPSTTGLRHRGYIKFKKPRKDLPLSQVKCEVDCTCFAGDTLVLMGDGSYKPIRDIVPGDKVYTHKGRIRRVSKNAERPLKSNEKTYRVTVSGFPGSFLATGDHPFYTLRGNETCRCGCGEPFENIRHDNFNLARQLDRQFKVGHHPSSKRLDDSIIEKVKEKLDGGLEPRVIASELGIGYGAVFDIKSGKLRPLSILENEEPWKWVKVKDFREREWFLTPWLEGPTETNSLKPHTARLLGYYTADGCIRRRVDDQSTKADGTPALKSLAFCFHENEYATLVDDVVKIATKLLPEGLTRIPQKNSLRPDNQEGPFYVTKNKTKSFDVIVYASPELIDLITQNIGEGSREKKLSPWMMALDEASASQFLTGLFLGDGHVCLTHRRVRWTSTSLTLVYQVSSLLNRLKIGHNITKIGNKGTAIGEHGLAIDIICGQPTQVVIGWLLPYLRTKDNLTDFSDNRLDYSRPEGRVRSLMGRSEVDFSGNVWDLTVEEDESFIVHGVGVHNCPDFRFRWAHVLKQHGASRVGPNSLNQALNRAPRITNPTGRVSLCKHLLALKDYIQGLMYTLPKTGLKSSEDVLSGVVKYAQKRYANHDQQVAAAKARDARFAAARALKRSGRPDPNPDNLPPVPEMEPPGGEPDVKEIIPVEEPVLPKTEQDIEDLEPPKPPIRRPTQRRAVDSLTRIRPMSSKNTPLNQEVATIQELLDDASMGANTPPTEGESAHGQALDLLRSIDQGLRDLNAGIQQIADLEGKENEDEEFDAALPPGQEELDEPPVDDGDGGGEPGKDDGENLDKELKNLGIPV